MHYRHLFSSRRHRESGDLCRLETLAAAARLGTAWLHGDAIDPSAPGSALPRVRHDRGGASCRCTPEHYHG
ncbi:MAG: hypothetical protein AB1560_14235 [Pseudomonadota bacterium]